LRICGAHSQGTFPFNFGDRPPASKSVWMALNILPSTCHVTAAARRSRIGCGRHRPGYRAYTPSRESSWPSLPEVGPKIPRPRSACGRLSYRRSLTMSGEGGEALSLPNWSPTAEARPNSGPGASPPASGANVGSWCMTPERGASSKSMQIISQAGAPSFQSRVVRQIHAAASAEGQAGPLFEVLARAGLTAHEVAGPRITEGHRNLRDQENAALGQLL
jgi:hypothetical protein